MNTDSKGGNPPVLSSTKPGWCRLVFRDRIIIALAIGTVLSALCFSIYVLTHLDRATVEVQVIVS